ncbi:serine/threonine-protein kinase [Arsukibacterium sp.]|uniref:serine/threonine-protein kinase n=1 Tax=Arsukibacterium sp. TaxID=1977258 RepID=UPI002FDA9207
MSDNLNALQTGSTLNHYIIEAVLGSGGFGIVYKAHHAHLEEQVVIKEFLPQQLAQRHGNTVTPSATANQDIYHSSLQRFMTEGRTLVKLRHPNVVRCRDLFTANGTAYLVMDFEDGLPLDELVRSLEAQGSRYTEQQLLHFLLPLADGLSYIHSQGVLHRDIKPANVFIRRSDGSPVIIDFGAAKQNFALVSQSQAPFTEFYAPLEQIEGGGEAKATVDIHAFGGLMYRLVTGQVGPKAEKRAMALVYGNADPLVAAAILAKGHYSAPFLATIDQCLAFKADERPQSMQHVLQQLSLPADPKATAEPEVAEHSTAIADCHVLDDLIALAGADSLITDVEMTMLLNKASSLGISKDKAQQYIVQQAVAKGWQIAHNNTAPAAVAADHAEVETAIKKAAPLWKWVAVSGVVVLAVAVYLMYPAYTDYVQRAELARQDQQAAADELLTLQRELEAEVKTDRLHPLTLAITPAAQYEVKVLNIRPRFEQGMLLAPGEYHLQIAIGQDTVSQWVNLQSNAAIAINFTALLAAATQETPEAKPIRLAADEAYYIRGNDASSFTLYQQAAQLGSVYADAQLAKMYSRGMGVTKNSALARQYRQTAEQKFARFSSLGGYENFLLGSMADFVEADYKTALQYYIKSAEQGNAVGQTNLGVMYEHGREVSKSESVAVSWYRKAAEQGYPNAQNNLGLSYANGRGVTKSDSTAVAWYRRAAAQGYVAAQDNLGSMYREGLGVTQSDSEAVKWYRKAAEQGHASAQTNLGFMYSNGRGVPQSYAEAIKWYRLAAAQDEPYGLNNMAIMYRDGRGVEKSSSESLAWFRKAAQKGHEGAQNYLKQAGHSW